MGPRNDILQRMDLNQVKVPMYDLKIQCEEHQEKKKGNWILREKATRKTFYPIYQPISGKMRFDMFCYFCEREYRVDIYSKDSYRDRIMRKIITYLLILYIYQLYQYMIWNFLQTPFFYGLAALFGYFILDELRRRFTVATNGHLPRIVRRYSDYESKYYLDTNRSSVASFP